MPKNNVFPGAGLKNKHLALAYRSDIDGVRALAVLPVVAYHYFPVLFPGGFIGVDIFFVISGYLITGILLKSFHNDGFSLLDFYQRRIRRIFPALVSVLIFCLVVGWFFLFSFEFEALGKHAASGAGFAQNITLWRESGYFDAAVLQKPLLHLWSLAVEEQFYIFWPLVLWLIIRARGYLLLFVLLITGFSFVLNILGIQSGHSVATFYLPFTRAWELMAGAGLAVLHTKRDSSISRFNNIVKLRHFMSFLGFGMILTGFAVIHPGYNFPGFWGLLPVLGSVLLIHAGPDAVINRYFLACRPMVVIGLISYPLYLWHWSLLSLAAIIFNGADLVLMNLKGIKVVALIFSFILAWGTYKYLERPIRRNQSIKTVAVLFVLVAIAGSGGGVIWMLQGVPERPGSLVQKQASQLLASMSRSTESERCFDLTDSGVLPETWSCDLGDRTAHKWIIAYGDSHALSMIPALDRYGKEAQVRVVFAGLSGCPGLLNTIPNRETGPACVELASQVISKAKNEHAAVAVLIQRWSYYAGGTTQPNDLQIIHAIDAQGAVQPVTGLRALRNGLDATLTQYQESEIPVILVEDNPQQTTTFPVGRLRFGSVSDRALNIDSVSRDEHERNQAPFNQLLRSVAARYPVVSILNTDSVLCDAVHCPWVIDGKFLYFDDDHLSVAGSMEIYSLLANALNRVLYK
jgi:peptidoglycan/LPS O-acetylase OafA/YrhL